MRARPDPRRRRSSTAATSLVLRLFTTVAGSLAAGPAHAQVAEAEALFNDGNKLMTDGKLSQACEAFQASNRIEPRAGTLIRLGDCREQNHQLASAWSAYKDALTRAQDPYKREVAAAKAAAVERRLSYLTITVPDPSRLAGLTLTRSGRSLDPIAWNRAVPVDGADYVIAGRAPGHQDWQTTVHVPAEGARIRVEVPRLDEQSVPPAEKPGVTFWGQQQPAPPIPVGTPGNADDGLPLRRKISIGLAGVTAVGVVAGIMFGVVAKSKQDDAFALCPDPAIACLYADRSNALIADSHHRALEANVALGVAAAAAIGAGVLWFTSGPGAKGARRMTAAASLAPHGAGIVVARF